jgi:hypothetical protein
MKALINDLGTVMMWMIDNRLARHIMNRMEDQLGTFMMWIVWYSM